MLSFVSLVAGTFVILNSFLMGLSDRARSFALMRALGMTRAQLVRMLIGEAALLGGVGTVLGMALGFGLSVLLNTIVASIVSATLPAVRLTWQPVALCLILGPGVALAATILPAKRCSVRSPLDALDDRRDAGKHDDASPWLHRAGLLCIAFPVLATVALVRTWLPIETLAPMLPPAMAFGLIGAALIVPATFARLSRPLEAALTRLAGVGGRLAIRDLRRHRLRTSLTIAVLAICVVISFGFGNSLISSVEDIRQWVDHIAKYDYFVRRLQPDLGTLSAPSLPESLGADLSALGSVAVADKMSWTTTRVSGLPVVAQISSHTGPGPIPLEVADGDPEALYGRLLAGELAIGSVLAQKFHVRVGDTVTVQTLQGERPFTVAALLSSYTGGGMMMELAWPVGVEAFGIRGVHVWMVTAAPGQREALGDALRSLGATDGFEVESMDDFRAMVDAAMAGVVGASWVIIAFVFVVASLGTVNTLTTHVIEQMRQIALMRAVAMTRRQVRRMIVAAAAAMVVTALVPGVALGFLLAIAMWASHHAVTGYRIDFSVHYSLLIAAVVAALVTAVAAAMFPARRAASMPIIEAIRYE